eukprot:76099-Pleurochrysis_carterae.AAC.1
MLPYSVALSDRLFLMYNYSICPAAPLCRDRAPRSWQRHTRVARHVTLLWLMAISRSPLVIHTGRFIHALNA